MKLKTITITAIEIDHHEFTHDFFVYRFGDYYYFISRR